MNDNRTFARYLTAFSNLAVALLVGVILLGPFEIDPHSAVLLALIARPGDIALGWLLQKRTVDDG